MHVPTKKISGFMTILLLPIFRYMLLEAMGSETLKNHLLHRATSFIWYNGLPLFSDVLNLVPSVELPIKTEHEEEKSRTRDKNWMEFLKLRLTSCVSDVQCPMVTNQFL